MKLFKKLLLPNYFLFLSIFCFLIFNFQYIFGNALLKGDDASSLYYPVIYYLKENLNAGNYPFYTEKMFSGYPIYKYSETGYLNPLRILLTYLLPFEKVLPAEYLIFFLLGIVGYFKFLREKKIVDSAIFFSHFIFFYNFQLIGRFVHQQLIFTIMALPLLLYLTEKFFTDEKQKKKKLYLILSGILIAFTILYGSFPGIFLVLFAQFIYILTNILKIENIKLVIKYYAFFFLIFISFSFFNLYPTYSLYKDSVRNLEEFSLTRGSISPILLGVSFLTPFPLGTYENYLGEKFSSSWFWHEIHTYQGLSFLIFALFGFIYLKSIEFKRFFIVTFSLFIILSTLKYTFFGNSLDIFPFNLFRYHLRFGSIFFFALSILGASILNNLFSTYEKERYSGILKNIIFLLLPISILAFFITTSLNIFESKTLVTHLKNALISNSIPYFKESLFSSILILSFLLIYKFTHRKLFIYIIPVIGILEIIFFSNILYNNNLIYKNLINQQIQKMTNFYDGKRVVFDNKIYGNQTLYYKNWNIYGYSAFDQKDYKEFMNTSNLNVRRYKENNYFLLSKLGVNRVIDENYNIHGVTNGDLFSKEYEEISLNNNHKIYKIIVEKDSLVQTLIKYDKNIDVLINSKKVEFPSTNQIFYNLNLTKGENKIEFIYQPRELYIGLIIGFLLSIFTIFTIKKIEFKG